MTKRPFSVTSLLFVVLSLTAWNGVRLGASIANRDLLAEFAPRPGPIYIVSSASFWTLGGLVLWTTIRRRHPHTPLFTALFIIGYAIWWWADRLLLQEANPNQPFALVLTILLLALTVYNIFNRKTTNYFSQRESHEQTPTDSNPA